MSILIGIVITGVIPFIGGIVLLLMGKIKATSFWAGVLAYIISMVGLVIVSAILSAVFMDMILNNSTMFGAISTLITSIFTALALAICVGACLKNQTFNGALSCGLGFGVSYAVTSAISFISTYVMAGMINSGQFDATYSAALDIGALTKEQLYEMKTQFIELTVSDVILQTAISIAFAAVMVAAAIFIMRGKCSKNLALGIIAAVMVIAIDGLATIIPSVIAASVVSIAIAAAAVIFAARMKDQIVQEQSPVFQDSFLTSIENAKNDQNQ